MIRLSIRRRAELACQQAVELVSDYLEGALPRAQRRRLEAHLTDCPDCPEYLAQIRATIMLLASLAPDRLSPPTRDNLVDLYRRYRTAG